MKLVVCCVYDRAACAYSRPYYVNHVGVAIRAFSDEVNGRVNDSVLKEHYLDYSLYELGTYDDSDASFELHSPKLIVEGKSVRVPETV